MKKLWKLEQLQEIKSEYTKEVIASMEGIINIMADEYGTCRNVDTDLGGYVAVLESESDSKEIKSNKLKELLPEYTDEIKSDDGTKYYSSLFLLSSDYAVIVYSNKELHELLLEKEL